MSLLFLQFLQRGGPTDIRFAGNAPPKNTCFCVAGPGLHIIWYCNQTLNREITNCRVISFMDLPDPHV